MKRPRIAPKPVFSSTWVNAANAETKTNVSPSEAIRQKLDAMFTPQVA